MIRRLCARSVVLCLGLIVAGGAIRPAQAQTEDEKSADAVRFEGLSHTSEVLAGELAGIEAGKPLSTSTESLDRAIKRLLDSGRFLTARYVVTEENGRSIVTFQLTERRTIIAVNFAGNEKFSDSRLGKVAGVDVGDRVDRFAIRDGRDAILSTYREAGYGEVTVSVDWEALDQDGRVHYRIEEGPHVIVREVVFEGNTHIDDRQLKRQVKTKTRLWIFRSGAFDEDSANTDVVQIRRFYRDKGFLDARASYRKEIRDDGDLRVVFSIEEGIRYFIESVETRGHTVFSSEELKGMMASKVGATMIRPQLDKDVRTVRERYWELGYIYLSVRALTVFSDEPGLVKITLEVMEGEQFRVGRIAIRGNARTKDKVVRRSLNLYPPDDLFDLNETKAAERRLVESKVFSSANIEPRGDQPGVRDIVIDVREAEKAGDFLFGFGVTSNSGIIGNVVLDLQNFDLFDWPRSARELFKFRSFFGGGQHLRLELQPGTDLNRFRIDFTEPYLMDKPLRFDVSAYLFSRGRDTYTEERVGISTSLGKRFEKGRLRGWSGEIALRLENVKLDDLDLFASKTIREDEGSNFMTSVRGTLVRDRTDSRFRPTTGDRLRLSYEQYGILGGDHSFGKASVRYQRYKTIKTDLQERKSVLRLQAEGGVVVGNAPVFERFFAGGTGTLRGFAFRGIGEREGLDDTNIGGDYLVLLGAEYSYPLIGDNVRGHVFLDTGTVGSGTYRAAVGVGVRIIIDILGPIPFEFNLAAPISTGEDDDEQVFSFLIGSLF